MGVSLYLDAAPPARRRGLLAVALSLALSRTLAAFVLAVLSASVLSCGPSFQAVYECDVQFEHCYGLDMSSAASDVKRTCWRKWFAGYTYGQSRDRVEYATTRVSELSVDPTVVGAVPSVDPASPPVPAHGSPMPKDAFVPPPNVSDGHADALAAADAGVVNNKAAHDIAARAPGADCADACAQRWSSCYGTCGDGSCGACDRAYRSCMPLCFRDEAHSNARTQR